MKMCLTVFSLRVTRESAGLRKRDWVHGHSVSPLAAPVWEHKPEHPSFWWLPCLTLYFYFENFPIIPSSFLPLICHFSGIKHIPRRSFRSLCFNSISLEKAHCVLISKWLFSVSSTFPIVGGFWGFKMRTILGSETSFQMLFFLTVLWIF